MSRKLPTKLGGGGAGAGPATAPLKRGPCTPEEDEVVARFVAQEGEGRWRTLPRRAGLLRYGKSCRLQWMNYLWLDIKCGPIADHEEDLIIRLHRVLGNRWSLIAGRLPGRTDNEIKNYGNSHLSKKLITQGIDPQTHRLLASVDCRHPRCTWTARHGTPQLPPQPLLNSPTLTHAPSPANLAGAWPEHRRAIVSDPDSENLNPL